jgi:hypothetical protein
MYSNSLKKTKHSEYLSVIVQMPLRDKRYDNLHCMWIFEDNFNAIRSRLNRRRRRRDNEIAKIKRTKQKPNNGRQNTRYKTGY